MDHVDIQTISVQIINFQFTCPERLLSEVMFTSMLLITGETQILNDDAE